MAVCYVSRSTARRKTSSNGGNSSLFLGDMAAAPLVVAKVGIWLMREIRFIVAALLLVIGAPLPAPAQTIAPAGQVSDPNSSICLMIHSAAQANALPFDFFARLIWQESRFRSDEIGPMTHTGARALGIAQFMPGTAVERGLFEPFNPVVALPKSGEFLAQLRDQFGNLGLAAAAYNAGPQRVRDFMIGLRDLPLETRNYVLAITGRPVEDWALVAKEGSNEGWFKDDSHAEHATVNCEHMALLNQGADRLVAEMQRKVPSWCMSLHHPNVGICGPVHEGWPTIATSSLTKLRTHSSVLKHNHADILQALRVTGLR